MEACLDSMADTKSQEPNICELCINCRKLSVADSENNENESQENTFAKCSKWLRTAYFNDADSICDSETSDRSESTKFTDESTEYGEEFTSGNKEIALYRDLENENHDVLLRTSTNIYRNITVTKSKNVHLGNITYINGPVYVNQTANIVNKQTIINQYINNNVDEDIKPPRIVDRRNWLAQPPLLPYENRKSPAKFVIIIHTATEEALTQADNILLVRLIQQFHVESRKWDDIGYNFMVGADGNIYEGRGWHAIGAHTYHYNKISVGIAFLGYYVQKLPPQVTMDNCKKLIEYGVKIGAIDENYKLVGHCQCTSTESPGTKLFQEIKTWKNWYSEINSENPPVSSDES